jgi:hypothetical protein
VEQKQLREWFSQLASRWPGRTVAVALEQSRGAVLYALMSFDFLRLCPINPKSLARYRETFYPSGSKGDPNDADLLREMVQKHAERLRPWKADTVATRQLQLLVEYRRQSVDEQTRLTNQLRGLKTSCWSSGITSMVIAPVTHSRDEHQIRRRGNQDKSRICAAIDGNLTVEVCIRHDSCLNLRRLLLLLSGVNSSASRNVH